MTGETTGETATDEIPLAGGVAHPGQVVRAGDSVRRPVGPHTAGEPAFVEMWVEQGGEEGERRNLAWIDGNIDRLRRALTDPRPPA